MKKLSEILSEYIFIDGDDHEVDENYIASVMQCNSGYLVGNVICHGKLSDLIKEEQQNQIQEKKDLPKKVEKFKNEWLIPNEDLGLKQTCRDLCNIMGAETPEECAKIIFDSSVQRSNKQIENFKKMQDNYGDVVVLKIVFVRNSEPSFEEIKEIKENSNFILWVKEKYPHAKIGEDDTVSFESSSAFLIKK